MRRTKLVKSVDVPCERFLNRYRGRFKFAKNYFEDRQAAIFFIMAN